MVMHARKTQRMNDGYFEKHQAHPYQNSKYSSSKSYGSSSDRYERLRDSPNGNYRSDSPDSQSPRDRDRSYQSKGSYLQKIREKERENRDYKLSRDKYSDCARSPKDKRGRESEHRTNSDRNDDKCILHPIKMSQNLSSRDRKPVHSLDKRDDRERVPRIGDWSEHTSSSGKKYYYNCKTEVSQWEQPREWNSRDRDRFRGRDRDRDRESDRCYRSSRHDKHSNSRATNSSGSKDGPRDSATSSRHWSSSSSRDDSDVPPTKDLRRNKSHLDDNNTQSTQDMDISPGDSTPTSEISYGQSLLNQANNEQKANSSSDKSGLGPVLLANALPRLISHPIHNNSASSSSTSAPTRLSPQQNQSVPQTITCGTNAPGPPRLSTSIELLADSKILNLRQTGNGDSVVLSVDTNHPGNVVDGPPTPTHSETPDCLTSKVISLPVSSPPGSLLTLQGMSSSLQALRPQGPSITPSLANHYRDDLVNHVRGWPAEILEKQAQKLADEIHLVASIQCSKVSAELKSARSIVRFNEIQATLQEQRILFLRQQIKELEELKSQNSFMSDDC